MNKLIYLHVKKLVTAIIKHGVYACILAMPFRLCSQEDGLNADIAFAKALESIVAMPHAEKVAAFAKLTNLNDLSLSGRQLSMTVGNQRIKAPKELAGGWAAGADSEAKIKLIAGSNGKLQTNIEKSLISWGLFINAAPAEAFAAMLSRVDSNVATMADAARILAITERQPGQQLKQQVPKETWKLLHESSNPCCKILALEKYDSTEQSPAELLGLYRECLMESFGYLQVRALEGVLRNKDFRPEVAALLKEYLNSNPATDDGTLPAFPAIIGNPVDGAKMILAEISKTGISVNASPSTLAPSLVASSGPSPPIVQPPSPKKAVEAKPLVPTPSEEPASLTPWSIIVVLILAALGLLWLLLKNRK
jgi:hypothetical protein